MMTATSNSDSDAVVTKRIRTTSSSEAKQTNRLYRFSRDTSNNLPEIVLTLPASINTGDGTEEKGMRIKCSKGKGNVIECVHTQSEVYMQEGP